MKKTTNKKFNKWDIVCLVCLLVLVFFIAFFIIGSLNYGKYSLKPGESVKIKTNPRTEQADYYSILIFKNPSGEKLELSGEEIWTEQSSNVFYKVKEQKVTHLVKKMMTMRRY